MMPCLVLANQVLGGVSTGSESYCLKSGPRVNIDVRPSRLADPDTFTSSRRLLKLSKDVSLCAMSLHWAELKPVILVD